MHIRSEELSQCYKTVPYVDVLIVTTVAYISTELSLYDTNRCHQHCEWLHELTLKVRTKWKSCMSCEKEWLSSLFSTYTVA